jgi:hypothetical protein
MLHLIQGFDTLKLPVTPQLSLTDAASIKFFKHGRCWVTLQQLFWYLSSKSDWNAHIGVGNKYVALEDADYSHDGHI